MMRALQIWTWSLTVVARRPWTVLGLAALDALWGFAAYRWLWLPESSLLVLLAGLVWALAQVMLALAVLAGTAASAAQAVAAAGGVTARLDFITFNRKPIVRTTLLVAAAAVPFLLIARAFAWVDAHALEVASFLTFHSQTPVSQVVIGAIFSSIEALIWMALAGFLVSFLIKLLRAGWREASSQCARTLAHCCCRAPFFTTLLSVVTFGGLSYLLLTAHPRVLAGFWDYLQLIARMGGALILFALGWLFWVLSLARLSLSPDESWSS